MARTRKKKKGVEKEQITAEPISCKLREISEYPSLLPSWNPDKLRRGRYAGSAYASVRKKEYAVIAYVALHFYTRRPQERSTQKKTPQAPYGSLRLLRWQAKKNPTDGKPSYVVVLGTNQKKNKNFWGIGLGKK